METFLLLVLFVLLVSGIIWFVRKIELSDCGHDDCITHCKHDTPTAIAVEEKFKEVASEPKAIDVDFNAIRPGTTPVAVKEQPAKKPRKPRKPQQSQPAQQIQKALPAKAPANPPAKKAQAKPAARTARPTRSKKPNN